MLDFLTQIFQYVLDLKWQSTPALLPGKSHGWRTLIGYSPRGREESDTTEPLHFHFHISVQFSSVAQSCPTLRDPMNHSTPGLPVHHQLPKLTCIKSVMPSSHLILCHPLLLLPPIPPSIRVFSNESTLHMRWPKYWSFGFSISPLNEYSGLISFRINWFDFLAVQGTLKSLLQHHSSKASIL